MKVRSRTLARLPRGYSIAVASTPPSGGPPAFLAGSEGDGPLLQFSPPDFRPVVVTQPPGGFISTCFLERPGRRFAVASTRFKPGFDAAEAEIRVYPLDGDAAPRGAIVARLPYTHRIALLTHGGREFLVASTLCAAKAFREDWTQPGGIHLAEIPADPLQPWQFRQIVPGLNQNHGLDFARLGRDRRPGYLLSALEGLFFLPLPADPDGAWTTERLDPAGHSDAFAFDWDGDGCPEIFSISPFHGHVLSVLRERDGAWQRRVIHDDFAFGHIVWAGDLLGRPGLLAGSRRERRELRLYRPAPDGGIDPTYCLIDEGIGPTQLTVVNDGPRHAWLYVAAHGLDEVRLYELEA